MPTTDTSTDPHVLALAARILPLLPNIDAGNDVRQWPADEAKMHREWREKLARVIAENLAADYEHTRDDRLTIGSELCSSDDEPPVGTVVMPIRDGGRWERTADHDRDCWVTHDDPDGPDGLWNSWDDLAYPPGVVVIALPAAPKEA